ncbi:MAG: TIM barrel protein [Planctomycetes bacterium]|nr:TIM barrel protein [Planctomycetota bacterium]
MDRRSFLVTGAGAAAAAAVGASQDPQPESKAPQSKAPQSKATKPKAPAAATRGEPFQLLYAPHFGMFENHAKALEDQLQFAADQGFRAWEDNGMGGRDEATQRRLAAKMAKLDMQMGVFVAHGDFGKPTFTSGRKEFQERVLADIDKACTVAGRVNAKWCTVVPGAIDPRQDAGYQFANCVELLKRCCDKIEQNKSELVMVLEPLNFRNHPNLYLTKIAQAFAICRAVSSPHCKILDDVYHQQITEGNLIPNIDAAWSEIAYFQTGDNPGRKEPGTGEIHFRNVFAHIHKKGFQGIVGMEHGLSQGGKEGELELIRAYREADAF